jgi:hypothetical protein
MGGEARSPDPRYCFHTPYVDVRPGRPILNSNSLGSKIRRDLSLRVHAFRPESGENASLAAAGRINVATDDMRDLVVRVRFGALRDVKYAFYGHFFEDGEIFAKDIKIFLDEPEDEAQIYVEPPRSVLALHNATREVRPANALIYSEVTHLHIPVSQDCGQSQVETLARGA